MTSRSRRGGGRATSANANAQRILVLLLVICATLPLAWGMRLILTREHLYPDIFGLWSAGRFVLGHAPAALYGGPPLADYQHQLGLPAGRSYPFSYPPFILLLLAPLGALPYPVAAAIWSGATLLAYVVAVAPWRWPRPLIGLLVLAPSSMICLLGGQNGFLTGALLIGGLRLLDRRPVLSGALLAALAYKPQFAILLPLLLLLGGRGKAMVGAGLCIILLCAATLWAFGVTAWTGWLGGLHANAGAMIGGRGALLNLMPTPAAAALLLGAPGWTAAAAQLAGLTIGVLAIWRVRVAGETERLALTPLAVVLCAPYAFDYDLPMVTAGVLTAMAARLSTDQPLRGAALPVLIACLLAPILLVSRIGHFAALVPVVFVATLGALWRPEMNKRPPSGR